MIKERNPFAVIAFSIISCGLYSIYWLFSTAGELNQKGHLSMTPVVFLVLSLIPFVGFYTLWQYASAVEKLSGSKLSGPVIFVVWIVFFPAAVFMIQTALNDAAKART